ncbi:MAG: class I SAM-dependent methyltransferase [Candidatus Omnitrophota bacterium]|nr:class I SAM-dependent methyltransferase [Candidatus Omnitrophota bacterium]
MHCLLCNSDSPDLCWEKTDPHHGKKAYWKCPHCSLVFLDVVCRLKEKDEKARYDLHENDPADSGYRNFINKLLDPLREKLKPGFRGLDFGCGPGPALGKMLEGAGMTVEVYDPFYFPDKKPLETSYDFITCTEVVEHFYSPRNEFLLLNRLLKPDGSHLAVMTEMLDDETDFGKWWYQSEPTHVCFYERKTFLWIAEWLGWQTEFPHKNVVLYFKGEETICDSL